MIKYKLSIINLKFLGFFLFLPILTLWCSCNQRANTRPSNENKNYEVIEINPDSILSEFNWSDIVESVRYIPLESKEGSYLSSWKKIKFYDGKIFIFDWPQQQKVFIFNTDGSLYGVIGENKGKRAWRNIRCYRFYD